MKKATAPASTKKTKPEPPPRVRGKQKPRPPKPVPPELDAERYVRPDQLRTLLGNLGRGALWRLVAQPGFPARIKLGGNVTLWKVSEVLAWLETQKVA